MFGSNVVCIASRPRVPPHPPPLPVPCLKLMTVPTTFIRDKKEEFDGKGKLVMGNRSMCAVLGPPSLLRPILGECDIVE